MLINIYSIRDSKAETFIQPFYMNNDGMAVRAITDCVQDENHAFNKHAEDYELYKIGQFDDQSGKVISEDSPIHIISCFQLKTTK